MPNRAWHENIVGTSNLFTGEIAAALPSIISLLLRLASLFLFFWYLVDFSYELGSEYFRFVFWLGLAALLALAMLCWKLANSWSKFDLDKNPSSGGLLPFILLDLIPIAAVAIATSGCDHSFCWGLLRFTQCTLKRIGIA